MNPPPWLEATLLLLLKPHDRENVSGDLLEEYRDTIVPARGPMAPGWYLGQVAGFLWRASWVWAALLAAADVLRFLADAFVPVSDFALRAGVTTWSHVAIALAAGFWSAWRTKQLLSGTLVVVAAGVIASVLSAASTAVIVALWHDPATLTAIRHGGGLEEAFILPMMTTPVLVVIGTVGAIVGKRSAAMLLRSSL